MLANQERARLYLRLFEMKDLLLQKLLRISVVNLKPPLIITVNCVWCKRERIDKFS